jgi:hypothetical protein
MFDANESKEIHQFVCLSDHWLIANNDDKDCAKHEKKGNILTWTKPKGNTGSVIESVRVYHMLRQLSIIFENVQLYLPIL